jgi:hypothetical protein
MGNCIRLNYIFNDLTKNFIQYNVIDKEYNVIVGIYSNNTNILINQGICIGYNNNIINKIKLGMIHKYDKLMVELYFENNIKLLFIKENKNQIKMILTFDTCKIEKYIDIHIINELKLINNNSEYIDLLYNILSKKLIF